jgi:geranylgeranyl diphosphate synthase type I
VPQVLGRARDLVAPAMRDAIGSLSSELRPIAEYHVGWRDEKGELVSTDGGKGVRPALAILSAEAVGADGSVGVPGAVAIELVHNFSLIHDDVIDNDAERRHRPTVWALFGIGQAVIVGDALLVLADEVLLNAPDIGGSRARAARLLTSATARMIQGQSLDMAFETRSVVSFEECLDMEAGKTGALLGCACAIGAVLAGASEDTVNALSMFGVEMGLAFQAVDDHLGIWGDPAVTGKPAWSDLRQKKKSLPVVAALQKQGPLADELAGLLARDELGEADIARAAELVEMAGGRSATEREAHLHFDLALSALGNAEITPRAHTDLLELANFIVDRNF